jgi:ATP-dependent Lhr-like helicase
MKSVRPGDVFVLNGRLVRLVKSYLLTAHVTRADNALPTIPRWYANKMPLASGLAEEVVRLRTSAAEQMERAVADAPITIEPEPAARFKVRTEAAADFFCNEYGLSKSNARALGEHFALQAQFSVVPTEGVFLIEEFPEGDFIHYFFHALIGRSANDALSRMIAQRVQTTKGGNALVTIDDYGFLLTLRSFQKMEVEDLRALFGRERAEEDLRLALAEASLVKWQFRGVAQTGLMVPRRTRGAERGARALQWSSEIIFEVLRQHEPDHPLLEEAYAEATLRFLDLPRALKFLETIRALPWDVRPLSRVSPFSFGLYVSKIKETMTLEDPETTIERLYHAMYGTPVTSPIPARETEALTAAR